jgi:hypothetical protein
MCRIDLAEVCTAPKNRGGGGAEDGVNPNAVAVAAHRLKAFSSGGAAAPRFLFHQGRRGRAALWYLYNYFLDPFYRLIALTWSQNAC